MSLLVRIWPGVGYGGGENVSRLGETIIGEEGEQEGEEKKKKKALEIGAVVRRPRRSGDVRCVVGKARGAVRTGWVSRI